MASKTRMRALVRAFDWRGVERDLAERPDLLGERDDGGRTWLHLCCSVNVRKPQRDAGASIGTADVLLAAGLGIDDPAFVEGAWKATPLWHAIAFGENVPLARHLLDRGCDPDHCLWAAVNRDSPEAIRLLFDHGATDPSNAEGTLLLAAIAWNKLRAAEALLELGADPDAQDADGRTALHHLLRKRPPIDPVRMLARHGARGDIPDGAGVTAADIMMRKRDPEFRELGARLRVRS